MSGDSTEPTASDGDQAKAAAPAADGATAAGAPKHADAAGKSASRKQRAERPLWRTALVNIAIALVVVSLVQTFLVRVHNVSSGSMEQTLGVTDRVLSSRLPYLGSGPQRGDIIIFSHGDTWDSEKRSPDPNPLKQALRWFGDITGIGISDYNFTVKRVIGVGGDTVACCDVNGAVTVNGAAITEPYIYRDLPFEAGTLDCSTTPRSVRCFDPITVPAGKMLVLGDHRSGSADSVISCRHAATPDCARFVTIEQVSGKVIARAWPPGPVS